MPASNQGRRADCRRDRLIAREQLLGAHRRLRQGHGRMWRADVNRRPAATSSCAVARQPGSVRPPPASSSATSSSATDRPTCRTRIDSRRIRRTYGRTRPATIRAIQRTRLRCARRGARRVGAGGRVGDDGRPGATEIPDRLRRRGRRAGSVAAAGRTLERAAGPAIPPLR